MRLVLVYTSCKIAYKNLRLYMKSNLWKSLNHFRWIHISCSYDLFLYELLVRINIRVWSGFFGYDLGICRDSSLYKSLNSYISSHKQFIQNDIMWKLSRDLLKKYLGICRDLISYKFLNSCIHYYKRFTQTRIVWKCSRDSLKNI